MSDNSSRKARSYEELVKSIRAVRKFATDSNTPEDPNQEPVPADKKEQITTPEDRNLPTPQPDNKGEGNDAGANTELEQLEAKDPEITPEKGENTEKELSVKAASLLEKIKGVASKKPQVKEANHTNVASDISLSSDTLKKVASIMLSTEEGQRQVANAVAKARADGIKLASLNELININQMYKAQEAMQKKYASYNDVINYHANEMNRLFQNDQACKYAYAQGAEDANAMMAAQGAPAVPPEAMAPTPEANANEAQQLVDMLIQSGMIDPNAGQQMVALAQQISGGQPMTPEMIMTWIEQCAQQGIIPPQVAQELVASLGAQGGEAPAAVPAPEAAPAGAPVDQNAQAKVAHVIDIANRLLVATQIVKTAAAKDGAVESEEVTPEDVDAVADVAVENGEISPEEADAATDLIAAGALEGAKGSSEEESKLDALAEALAEAGVTEEEVEQALEELAAEEGLPEAEVAGDPIDELVSELEAAGVSEEEVAQAIEELAAEEAAEGGEDEEISDEDAMALAQELEAAGIDEETLAQAIAASEGTEAESDEDSKEDEESKEDSDKGGEDEEITVEDFEEDEAPEKGDEEE